MLVALFVFKPAQASETIYIMPDGSLEPPTAPIRRSGNVYSFIDDISGQIFVNTSNIIIDGQGYILQEGGFALLYVENVIIKNTKIMNCGVAIYLEGASHNEIFNNLIENNLFGIKLWGPLSSTGADENRIYNNQITNSSLTNLYVSYYASDNIIYHNNFFDGMPKGQNFANTLDDGYPSGGNYWKNHENVDVKKGPNQDQHGSDDIVDTPYIIDHANRDRYPLVTPFGSPLPPNYALTIAAASHGTTNPDPGVYTYSQRQNVTAEAIPSNGYALDHWELDEVNIGSSNPINVMMDADHTLHPVFLPTHTLTINTTLGGSTDPNPGNHTYTSGTMVTVTATPSSTYYFDYWKVDGVINQTNPITVTVDTDQTLHAVFTPIQYTLTITTTLGGSTSPMTGTYQKPMGETVNVTASPQLGYYLDHWELDNTTIKLSNPVKVVMNMNHTLNAVFKQLNPGHDIAVKGITSKTVVGQDSIAIIKVSVMNIGSYPETFNTTTYANTTIIDTIRNITLESGNHTILEFMLNSTNLSNGNYTLRAQAPQVMGETETANNNCTEGFIIITIKGDITGEDGYPDNRCDMRDVGLVARYFGQNTPPAPANCDLTGPTMGIPDEKIDMRDVGLAARNFGETDL
jgi:hypothetical protein